MVEGGPLGRLRRGKVKRPREDYRTRSSTLTFPLVAREYGHTW
jgi:hypothetical protein